MTIAAYAVQYCDQCRGERPHSRKGKCQACWLRRGKPLSRSKRLRTGRAPEAIARWAAVKHVVFERDGYQCQWPAGGDHAGDLDAHHRRLKGHGGVSDDEQEYGLAGLVSLCRRHHDLVHLQRKKAEQLGFIVPRFPGDDPESVPVTTASGLVYLLPGGSRVAAEPGGAT